jgi:hypothetical protein
MMNPLFLTNTLPPPQTGLSHPYNDDPRLGVKWVEMCRHLLVAFTARRMSNS